MLSYCRGWSSVRSYRPSSQTWVRHHRYGRSGNSSVIRWQCQGTCRMSCSRSLSSASAKWWIRLWRLSYGLSASSWTWSCQSYFRPDSTPSASSAYSHPLRRACPRKLTVGGGPSRNRLTAKWSLVVWLWARSRSSGWFWELFEHLLFYYYLTKFGFHLEF